MNIQHLLSSVLLGSLVHSPLSILSCSDWDNITHSSLQVYESLFTDATPERIDELFDQLDESHTGYIDYLEWSKRVDLKDVPKMVKNCRTRGPLFQSSLTEDEFRQLRRMMRRLHDLADAASKVPDCSPASQHVFAVTSRTCFLLQ